VDLSVIDLSYNQIEHLHRDTFKDNLKLTYIGLHQNKLTSLHPQMFAHLSVLTNLDLEGNTCIDKNFSPVTSLTAVEKELMICGAKYLVSATELLDSLSRHERKFESIENQLKTIGGTIDEKFAIIFIN
jgi:hypothetical protein